MAETVMVHIRLRRDLIREIDHAAVDAELSRAEAIESMLRFTLDHRSPVHAPREGENRQEEPRG